MSEVCYRSQLRQILAAEEADSVSSNFIEALLSSALLIPQQLRRVLEGDQEEIKPYVVNIAANSTVVCLAKCWFLGRYFAGILY